MDGELCTIRARYTCIPLPQSFVQPPFRASLSKVSLGADIVTSCLLFITESKKIRPAASRLHQKKYLYCAHYSCGRHRAPLTKLEAFAVRLLRPSEGEIFRKMEGCLSMIHAMLPPPSAVNSKLKTSEDLLRRGFLKS